MKSLNYKLSPITSGGLEVPLLKDFINDLYTNDFAGIIHNDNTSNESDIEIDLELNEKEDDKEEVETLAPVVDDEVTIKLLRQDTVCFVTDND